jgi:hypothetical protein
VFDEVSGLVTSILDGYNVCIMAYGQTGSGKTYTIEGPAEDPGVNSRALAELFRSAEERSTGFKYAFSASVLEIYNEQIFDLLAGSRDSGEQEGTAIVVAGMQCMANPIWSGMLLQSSELYVVTKLLRSHTIST